MTETFLIYSLDKNKLKSVIDNIQYISTNFKGISADLEVF